MNEISNLFKIAAKETEVGNHQDAIYCYEEVLRLSRNDKRAQHIAHWGIGESYLNIKQYNKAKIHLHKAIELSPNEPIYHYLLGCTYTYTKEADKAICYLEKAIRLDNSKDIYWNQLGWAIGFFRDIDKGINYLKKALSMNPTSSKFLQDLCILYTRKGNSYSEALVCIEEAMRHDPNNLEIMRIKKDVDHFKSEYDRLSRKTKN